MAEPGRRVDVVDHEGEEPRDRRKFNRLRLPYVKANTAIESDSRH
jgi:hypothetical protein